MPYKELTTLFEGPLEFLNKLFVSDRSPPDLRLLSILVYRIS